MLITIRDLQRWKKNAVLLADKLGLDTSVLNLDKVYLDVIPRRASPSDIGGWYGFTHYSTGKVLIEVYRENIASDSPEIVRVGLSSLGMPENIIDKVMTAYAKITPEEFYEIYNQSGMDHELIGHAYHYLKNENCDESIAVKEQLRFAQIRAKSSKSWKIISEIMPTVLGYIKGIDELKEK
ncbi:hypothetical protein KY346_00505 [Candidatus Woesearchaeota archaeon]|nr:hypothetical protein [Candidatus Woesearchaeota archaeon]